MHGPFMFFSFQHSLCPLTIVINVNTEDTESTEKQHVMELYLFSSVTSVISVVRNGIK